MELRNAGPRGVPSPFPQSPPPPAPTPPPLGSRVPSGHAVAPTFIDPRELEHYLHIESLCGLRHAGAADCFTEQSRHVWDSFEQTRQAPHID